MASLDLEQSIWSDADFEQMGWHDSMLWAIAFDPDAFEVLFDLDYIFKWVHPKEEGGHFRLWVAPVTMVFARAHSVRMDAQSPNVHLEVLDLVREQLDTPERDQLFRFISRIGTKKERSRCAPHPSRWWFANRPRSWHVRSRLGFPNVAA